VIAIIRHFAMGGRLTYRPQYRRKCSFPLKRRTWAIHRRVSSNWSKPSISSRVTSNSSWPVSDVSRRSTIISLCQLRINASLSKKIQGFQRDPVGCSPPAVTREWTCGLNRNSPLKVCKNWHHTNFNAVAHSGITPDDSGSDLRKFAAQLGVTSK
jgi:hypothetical protein